MKTIKVNINDELFDSIKSYVNIKKMTGTLYGTVDEFLYLLAIGIEDEKEEVIIKCKDVVLK